MISSSDSVAWGLAGQIFVLRSAEPEVLAVARTVFAPWEQTGRVEIVCKWTVERCAGGFYLTCDRTAESILVETPHMAVLHAEYGSLLQLGFPETHLTFHGALLKPTDSVESRAVLLLGHAQAGKSTLATALWSHGWRLLCDDTVYVDLEGGEARPAPRRVAVRRESQPLLGAALWASLGSAPSSHETSRGLVFHPHEVDGTQMLQSVELGAVVILSPSPTGPTLEPLDPAGAVFALAPHVKQFRADGLGAVLEPLSRLASRNPISAMSRRDLQGMVWNLTKRLSFPDRCERRHERRFERG